MSISFSIYSFASPLVAEVDDSVMSVEFFGAENASASVAESVRRQLRISMIVEGAADISLL